MRYVRAVCVCLALLTCATVVVAQEQEPLPDSLASVLTVGGRVRVVSTALKAQVHGAVIAVDDTMVTLAQDDGPPLRIPLQSIAHMDASLGRKRNTLKGLLIGTASFAALGFAFPVDPNDCGPYSDNLCSRGEAVAGSALVGAALGAGIGALIKSERWTPITVALKTPRATRRGARPVAVAVSIRF